MAFERSLDIKADLVRPRVSLLVRVNPRKPCSALERVHKQPAWHERHKNVRLAAVTAGRFDGSRLIYIEGGRLNVSVLANAN